MTDNVVDGAQPVACTSGNPPRVPSKKRKLVEGPCPRYEPMPFRPPDLRMVSGFMIMSEEMEEHKFPLRNDCKLNEKNNNGLSTLKMEELTLDDHSYCVRASDVKSKPKTVRSKQTFVDLDCLSAAFGIENKEGPGQPEQDPNVACEVVIETYGEEFLPFEPIFGADMFAKSCLSRTDKLPDVGRKRIGFDEVTVFFFGRTQGFNVVPQAGDGFTLALDRRHSEFYRYRFDEYCMLTARERQEVLMNTRAGASSQASSRKYDESVKEFLKDPSEVRASGIFEVLDEETAIKFINETPSQKYIQPISKARRRALLRKAGVPVDVFEDYENTALTASRLKCGCDCKGGCRPDKCSCALLEISCLVDSAGYPCSCNVKTCANPYGCEWFDPAKKLPHPCPVTTSEMQRRLLRDPEAICFHRSS